jgi:hypothetical protein
MRGPNYRIIRWEPAPDRDDGTMLVIGDFPDYMNALHARDADVLLLLAENDGFYRITTHWVLGRTADGETDSWTLVTAAGVDPCRPHPPTLAELIDTRDWLASIHARCT